MKGELLSKHSAITGDELRELSPFDLPIGDFDQPVSSGQNRVMNALEESINDLRSVNPSHQANRIIDQSKITPSKNGNGRCSHAH